ncbi:uncharacterized protein LOC120266412 isoform X2 [Dioscorea cayenensis subsp. rotundata]|uniref:Uncharacterized protein LOC120266412 isoform X2 n=1 Tax=Dioscorea cayennensis subsp. rotundata TaxID=55577 RepID=A0AB40BR76_DIOCR|nr:uncharacterized protein LOC120266412 isoform X2 [Dioscorea cayenensis subsp. rotundata]
MTNCGKKQDYGDLENLIKEIDKRRSKGIEDVREQNSKALDEIRMLLADMAKKRNGEAAQSSYQQQVALLVDLLNSHRIHFLLSKRLSMQQWSLISLSNTSSVIFKTSSTCLTALTMLPHGGLMIKLIT